MTRDQLLEQVKDRTLLCVGPMSRNCVDVTIDLANEFHIPMMLIASRRQVECAELGGGYVENWTTKQFVQYVRERDHGSHVICARDHGGPWQNPKEDSMNEREAMASAKVAFRDDILSGMDVIHLDASIDPHGEPGLEVLLERTFELYEYCWKTAKEAGRAIAFEVGTEEQVPYVKSTDDFDALIARIQAECEKRGLPQPVFVVGQTGTKVMEARNVGNFNASSVPAIDPLLASLKKHSMMLKVHNGDYLTDEILSLHPKLGIGGVNIAPEYGVQETQSFLNFLESHGQEELAIRFLDLAFKSQKWVKWMLPDTDATIRDRSIIAGHYVFAKSEFKDIKEQAARNLSMKVDEVDRVLKKSLRSLLMRHVRALGPNRETTQKAGIQ